MSNYTPFDSDNYRCTRVVTVAYDEIDESSYGINCQEKSYSLAANFYQCHLNIDVQNETSYACNKCFNDTLCIYRYNTECDVEFKLSMDSMKFENALKKLWLSLPVPQICAWDELSCVNFRNGSVVGQSSLEVYQCVWSRRNGPEQLLNKQLPYNWSFLFVITFIIAGGVGNILVCLAVALDRRLQNVTNYFLLSLAVADLLVSLLVMPMGAIQGFLGYWPLGAAWCNVYVTCDVLACSASIMHMCFISISRFISIGINALAKTICQPWYMGIRNPLKSRHHSTKKVVIIKISLVWLLSMTVSSLITVLGIINKKNIMPNHRLCVINNRLFWILGSLVAFYIPMMTMMVSFALTVNVLKKQAILAAKPVDGRIRRRIYGFDTGQHGIQRESTKSSPNLMLGRPKSRQTRWRDAGFYERCTRQERSRKGMSLSHPQLSLRNGSEGCRRARAQADGALTPPSIAGETARVVSTTLKVNIPSASTVTLRCKKDRSLTANAVANEQKATKVLGLVFFTFVICWTPFFLLNIIFASCPSCFVPDNVVEVCLWLGYVSSTINPIIYTVFNRTFRTAFLRLICCHCIRSGRRALYRAAAGSTHGALQ